VREAFELALDREGIVRWRWMAGRRGNQWVASSNPFYAKNVRSLRATLRAMLRNGRDEPVVHADDADDRRRATDRAGRAGGREAGFDVKIRSTECATSLDLADKGQFDAYVLAWSGRAAPDGNIFSFDGCKQPLNYAGYCKPEVDDILNRSRTTRDGAERSKLFGELAAIVLKDRPIVYLYHRHWLWAYVSKLEGLRPVPDGLVRVTGVRFK
jgi:peptide/nickel transport system substrate-binding protein